MIPTEAFAIVAKGVFSSVQNGGVVEMEQIKSNLEVELCHNSILALVKRFVVLLVFTFD